MRDTPSPQPHSAFKVNPPPNPSNSTTTTNNSTRHRAPTRIEKRHNSLLLFRPNSVTTSPSPNSHQSGQFAVQHPAHNQTVRLPDSGSPLSPYPSTSSSSSNPSPSLLHHSHGRSRLASEDTTATSATWDSNPQQASQKQQQQPKSSTFQGWFRSINSGRRHSMTAAAAATGTTRQFNDIQWRDPWSKDRGHPDSSAGKTTDTSFVASLGSAPIAWSEVDRSPSAATSSQNSYKPLIGPSSVFTKPLLAGEEPPRVRTPLQQRQHQPDSHARPRRSSFNSHNPIPRASAKKEEQRSMSHFRRPRSASFSDLRSAARDHAKSRDPKNMPPVPRLPPMQYAPKPALGCFPPITARPRLQSIDVTPPTRLYTQQHPGQLLSIPSRSSMASEISVSAQSMIRQMNSFAEEREAWRQGHRYPQGINPSTTHRDKRFKSMPVGTKRPILPPSESSATLTPQSCSLKVPQTRGRQWKRGKSNKKETQDSAQVQPNPQPSPSKHYNEDSRRTDDLFRSPTPPRRFQRTRQTSEMLPEFSFEQNGPSHLNPTESPAATRRKRTSSLSALDHASHYSLTPSGHLVGYGMALGETSREQLAQYYGTATNTGEPERFREQSTDTPLKRTSKGDYYRLPMRSAPTPPDLQHLEDPDDSGEVVFSGQNVHRESSHPTLHVDDNSAHSGTLHGQSVDNDAHLALESELPVQRLPLPNEGQSRHTGSSQSRASSSALSDDRFTNFENLFFQPPSPANMDRSVNPLDNDAPSFDPPVTFVSPPDTVVSHSPDLRQSLESGRVTEDSHSTTVDSQPAPQTYLSLKDANGANVSAKRKVKQPSALVRVGSIKEPRKPEVVIESTRHSFMPELDDDDDDSEDESTSSRPLRPQRSSMDQMSNRSFIDFDQSPPRGLEDHPLNHQTPQSFLDDFSPPTSPVTADTTPKKPSSQMAARDSSPTIAQRLNTSASSNMLNISRASYAASSLSSLHVDNFPQPPEAYPLPPSVHSNASRPTLASHGSDLTQRMSRRASQPELRLRPSMAHTDSETTVFTFAPESFLDTDPSRSNLNLPNKSRSQVNDFTGESSGPSAYATAAEELNSNFDGPSSTHDNFPTDTPGVPKNQSGPPLGVAARNRDEVPRSRTWSSSFIQYWRQSLPNGDDGAEQGGRSRRSSGLWSIRTYSDPAASPRLQARGLDSPDEIRR